MNDTKEKYIKQTITRIIELEPQIHKLIGLLDLGISGVYNREETVKCAAHLSNTLGQMDSDLVALIDLLGD